MLGFPPTLALLNTALELTTLGIIAALFLLSLISLMFMVWLTLRSRRSPHLRPFNSLWTVRLFLVAFVVLWCINELFRLPSVRRRYLSSVSVARQVSLCRAHVILSLGLLEPGFLAALLFLVSVSVKKKTPRGPWGLVFVFATCAPLLAAQTVLLKVSALTSRMPEVFSRVAFVARDDSGDDTVLCGYPLISTIVFAAFAGWYCLCFTLSCLEAAVHVINKGLRSRICGLIFAVMVSLPLQVLALGLSSLWLPKHEALYGGVGLLVFLMTSVLAAIGECIVVIFHVVDSLAAGDSLLPWPHFQGNDVRGDAGLDR